MNQTVNQAMSQLSYRTGSSPFVGSLYGFSELCCNSLSQPIWQPIRTKKMEPQVAADEKNMSTPSIGSHITKLDHWNFGNAYEFHRLHTTIVHDPLKNPDFKKSKCVPVSWFFVWENAVSTCFNTKKPHYTGATDFCWLLVAGSRSKGLPYATGRAKTIPPDLPCWFSLRTMWKWGFLVLPGPVSPVSRNCH